MPQNPVFPTPLDCTWSHHFINDQVPALIYCPYPSLHFMAELLQKLKRQLQTWGTQPARPPHYFHTQIATCFQRVNVFPRTYLLTLSDFKDPSCLLLPAFSLNHSIITFSASSTLKNSHRTLFAAMVLLKTIFSPNSIYKSKHLKNKSIVRKITVLQS